MRNHGFPCRLNLAEYLPYSNAFGPDQSRVGRDQSGPYEVRECGIEVEYVQRTGVKLA
jgi:hypothetical protein